MAITPSRAVRSANGQLMGVVGGDIFLSGISRFLKHLHAEELGHTYIFERSGFLVASSSDERPFKVSADGKRKTRIRVTESSVPEIASSSKAILHSVGDLNTVVAFQSFEFRIQKDRYFVEIAPFKDQFGLSLLVATVLPESAYAANLQKHTADTIALIALALIVMAVVAILMAKRITRPIVELTNSIDEMAKGNLSEELAIDRNDEIGRLSQSFNHMARALEDSFSALKDRETRLQNQERFLDSIVENIPNMVFVKEADELNFVRFNRAGEKLLGIPRQEMIGKSDRDFFSSDQAEAFISKDREVLASKGEMDITEEPIDTRYLGRRILHTKKIGVYDDAGAPLYLLGISEDITEKLRAEEELRAAKHEAEEANKAKSEFLATMSHDLRTPLNAIMGFSDMMRERAFGPLGDAHYEEYANDIYSSGALLESLINDVLDLSKIEAGKYDLHFQPVKIASTIDQCIRQISSVARLSKTSIVSHVSTDLPDVVTDERVFTQVLNNLLSNAVKFTEDGGVITVTANLTHESTSLVVSVADNGIGMSPADIEKATRPFEQVNSNNARRHKGTGLGLYLCTKFIQLMDGQFSIQSTLNKGTTVTFELPIEPKAELS